MKYFDTHAHYNDEVYVNNVDEILNECRKSGVDRIVNVGYNKKSSIDSIILSEKYDYIHAAIGVHPHDVNNDTAQDIFDVYNKNKDKRIVAIGEIGLDYAYVKDNKEAQIKLFIEQIELANTLKLPILIHSRDASSDTYNVIRNHRAEFGTLFHCFQPSDELVGVILENGYMVAFGGNITYKRNESFKNYIEKIPLNQMVIETDAPYLAPVPLRGTTNTSANLHIICSKLAEYKNKEEEVIANSVYNNSLDFFKIKE